MKKLFFIALLTNILFPQTIHWRPLRMDGIVYDIAINNAGNIYICEDEVGVIRSNNFGNTWEYLYKPQNKIRFIEINRNNNTIFAASVNGPIYKSLDDGLNWDSSDIAGNFTSIHISPDDHIFAGTSTGYIIKSTNNGGDWDSVFIVQNKITSITSCPNGIILLSTDTYKVYISTDYGSTWQLLPYQFRSIGANANDVLFAVDNSLGIVNSTDCGNSWNFISNIFGDLTIDSLSFYLFDSTPGGNYIYRSIDSGYSFHCLGGLYSGMRAIAVFNDSVYLSTSNGVYKLCFHSNPIGELNFFPLNIPNKWQYIYNLEEGGGVHRFKLVYYNISRDTLINGRKYFYQSVNPDVFCPGSYKNIWLRYDGNIIYILNDSDQTYMDFNLPVNSTFLLSNFKIARVIEGSDYKGYETNYPAYSQEDITQFRNNLGLSRIYGSATVGPDYGYEQYLIQAILYDSLGNAQYYTSHYKPIISLTPIFNINSSAFHLPVNVNHHYSHIFDPTAPHTSLNFIESVVMNSYYAKEDTIINSLVNGAYVSGSTTYNININLDTNKLKSGYAFYYRIEAKDKGIIPEYGYSPDSGYYKCVWDNNTSVSILNQGVDFSLAQNYPNPFNAITTIPFSLSKRSLINISVYNVLGKKELEIFNSELEGGFYEIPFDAKNLPSGVYFYKLTTDFYCNVKKMILLR